MKVPAVSLLVNVAVDVDHVTTLSQNIQENGQLSPVVVRKLTHDIVDGFHRVSAMQLLGMDVEIVERTFKTDEDFLAARIVSATQHEGVKVERAVKWIDQEWSQLPIAKLHKSAKAAFSAWQNEKASDEAVEWVEKAAKRWGVSPHTILHHWMKPEKSTNVGTPPPEEPAKSTKKKDRPLDDPESMPAKFRNAWADAKVCEHELAKISEDDLEGAPEEHCRLLFAVIEPLREEVERLVAWFNANI